MDRGRCTDAHSKEWCDAHGYENNRPVGGKIILTGKAAECYWFCIRKGIMTGLTSLVSPAGAVLYASEAVVESVISNEIN